MNISTELSIVPQQLSLIHIFRLPKLIDCDVENERILKDYIDDKTAYELVLQNEMKPDYIEQIREMCRLLNPKGINIDYFPTNFILNNGLLWYIDYCLLYTSFTDNRQRAGGGTDDDIGFAQTFVDITQGRCV